MSISLIKNLDDAGTLRDTGITKKTSLKEKKRHILLNLNKIVYLKDSRFGKDTYLVGTIAGVIPTNTHYILETLGEKSSMVTLGYPYLEELHIKED